MSGLKYGAPRAVLAFGVVLFAAGCGGGSCPSGYEKLGGYCRVLPKDAGAMSSTNATTSEAGSGSPTGAAPVAGNSGGALAGKGAATANATGTAAGGSAPAGQTGAKSNTSAGQAGAGSNVSSGASAGSSAGSTSADPCRGTTDRAVCDGQTLHECGAGGVSTSQESCMTAALCQAGLASGVCAVCTPGTFHCEGTELDVCSDAGQYMKQEDCATAALCSEAAGMCTPMMCIPSGMSCSSDGSTLNTCNSDGSAFADQKDCAGKGCNAARKSCNTCSPGEKTCSGTSLMTCAADGQAMTMMACTASGECSVAACQSNACAENPKPAGSPCGASNKCDANGKCVACLAPADCTPKGDCVTPTCSAGKCGSENKPKGTPCGTDGQMACNGAGACASKCGNGTLDSGEQCDQSASGSAWADACSNCELTKDVYRACGAVGVGDECGGANSGWFCSPVGACTRVCGNTACPAPGQCLTTGPDAVCAIPCTPGGRPSPAPNSCLAKEQCNYYGAEGQQGFVAMCGWISVNPATMMPWCPRELEAEFGGCFNPDTGAAIHNDCYTHPDPMKYPMGC